MSAKNPRARRPAGTSPGAGAGGANEKAAGGDRLALALPALALAAAVAAVYASAFGGGFTLDAAPIIRDAARVHAVTWANVAQILTTDYWAPGNVEGLYRPLTTLSYLFNWAVLGNADRASGYVALNLLLQWGNALLVLAVGRRVLRLSPATALATALLFAVHPVATEVVANIVGRADLLAAASVLGGLLTYAAAAAAPPARRRAWLVATAAIFLLGLLAKESAVTLAGVVVLYDLVFRLRPASAGAAAETKPRAGGAAGAVARAAGEVWRLARGGWLALVPPLVAVALVRAWIFHQTPATAPDFAQNPVVAADFATARLTALAGFARSVGLLLWPRHLCPDYSAFAIPLFGWGGAGAADALAVAGLAALLAAVALAVRLRRRAPAASFWIGFLLVAWLPTSNLLFHTGQVMMAERFLYLPLAGFCGVLVLGAEALARRVTSGGARRVAWAGLGVVAVLWGARAAQRNLDWRDDLSLWRAAVAACPGSYLSHQGLAGAITARLAAGDRSAGSLDDAIALQETAIAILERGAPEGARLPAEPSERLGSFYLSKAILAAKPERYTGADGGPGPAATQWAGRAAARLGAAVAAIDRENAERRRAAGGRPVPELGTQTLFVDLGLAELHAGRPEPALAAFTRARAIAPGDAEAAQGAAVAALALGRGEEALAQALAAFLLDPRRPGLGDVLVAAYAAADPGGCGVAGPPGQARLQRDCPALQTRACTAAADLESRLRAAADPSGEDPDRAARLARVASEARAFGCPGR